MSVFNWKTYYYFHSRNEIIISLPICKFYLLYIEDKDLSHRKLKYKNYEFSREYLDCCQCFINLE